MAKPDPAPAPRRGRKPAGSQAALTEDRVVTAALALLDETGLHGFSVRDLARALAVYPASVYWHVGSRNRLLALMVTRVLRDIAPDVPQPCWQDWVRALFRRYRQAIQRHPNIAPLIGAQLVSNGGADLDLIERLLAVLSEAGFRDQRLVEAYSAVTAAQVGFVTMEFAPLPQDSAAEWSAAMRALIASADPERHPLLARHLPRMANRSFALRWENGTTAPMDRAFALYVETVVAGLERIAAHPA